MKVVPPIPPYTTLKKYPFVDMRPGDYEVIELKSFDEARNAQKCAHISKRKHGYKFITRINGSTLQVWCTAGTSAGAL